MNNKKRKETKRYFTCRLLSNKNNERNINNILKQSLIIKRKMCQFSKITITIMFNREDNHVCRLFLFLAKKKEKRK